MKIRSAVVGVAAMLVAAGAAFGQSTPKGSTNTIRAENIPQTAEGQAWQNNITPTEFHNNLKVLSGAWNCEITVLTPGAPAQPSTGTMVNTFNLGGRFLVTAFNGEVFGQTFQGTGTWGYNTVSNRYESTWVDNMSTGIVFETGSYDNATKTFTMTGNFDDPQTGQKKTQKTVYTVNNENQYTINFFEIGTDGAEKPALKFVCTRRTAEAKTPVRTEGRNKVETLSTTPAADGEAKPNAPK